MKKTGVHEGAIEQMYRLFDERLYAEDGKGRMDECGRYRVDENEVKGEIQDKVAELWKITTMDNFKDISDWEGYKRGFQQLFGFGVDGIDYEQQVEMEVAINNLFDASIQGNKN